MVRGSHPSSPSSSPKLNYQGRSVLAGTLGGLGSFRSRASRLGPTARNTSLYDMQVTFCEVTRLSLEVLERLGVQYEGSEQLNRSVSCVSQSRRAHVKSLGRSRMLIHSRLQPSKVRRSPTPRAETLSLLCTHGIGSLSVSSWPSTYLDFSVFANAKFLLSRCRSGASLCSRPLI